MNGRRLLRESILPYLPALGWAVALIVLGGVPNLRAPHSSLPLDKVAHFLLYGTLGALAAWGWRRAGQWPSLAIVLALALGVGVLDEIHQLGVAGRTGDARDWLADAAGILIFAALVRAGGRTRDGANSSG